MVKEDGKRTKEVSLTSTVLDNIVPGAVGIETEKNFVEDKDY